MEARFVPNCKAVLVLAVALGAMPAIASDPQYSSADEAIAALAGPPSNAKWAAVEYLAKHPEGSVPRLEQMVIKQEKAWIYASAALVRSKDPRVLPLYIDLQRDNFYVKEADGTRMQFGLGSKNGCLAWSNFFGSILAGDLGRLGDKRAIPVLREAVAQGDSGVRQAAYEALYRLGDLSLDDLFDLAKKGREPGMNIADIIEKIGWEYMYEDPRLAIKVFDRIIAELPSHEREVAGAHFWKVQCFEMLQEYDDAIQECQEVMKFSQFDNLTHQIEEKEPQLRARADQAMQSKLN